MEKSDDIPNINRAEDWAAMRQNWVKERAAWMRANADRYFMTDEELPLSRHIMLLVISASVVAFILWASFAPIDEVTHGTGKIIPTKEAQQIQNLEGGIVDELLVAANEPVKAGQILVRLRDLDASSNFGSNQARYLGLLAAVTRLQAEADGKETVEFPDEVLKGAPQSVVEEQNAFTANQTQLESQRAVMEKQLQQRQQEISELTTKEKDLAEIIRLSVQEKNMIAPLVARGSAPKIELVRLERALREKQTELNAVKESMPRAQAAVDEAQARIDELNQTARAKAQTELATKLAEMNALKETLSALSDRKERTEIRSPVDGIVNNLKIKTVGGVVKPGETIMEVVPTGDQLLIEARVRPADIAFIHPKQKAVVKITAYDYSIYGSLQGEVVALSPDTITNERGESFYHVKVRTMNTSLKRGAEVFEIGIGMEAQVDIVTGRKTVMDYILKPFTKTVQTAMRER